MTNEHPNDDPLHAPEETLTVDVTAALERIERRALRMAEIPNLIVDSVWPLLIAVTCGGYLAGWAFGGGESPFDDEISTAVALVISVLGAGTSILAIKRFRIVDAAYTALRADAALPPERVPRLQRLDQTLRTAPEATRFLTALVPAAVAVIAALAGIIIQFLRTLD